MVFWVVTLFPKSTLILVLSTFGALDLQCKKKKHYFNITCDIKEYTNTK